jgi:phage terminase large subunit-like protein
MPWQRYVADVALEVNPDTGRLAYREIRLTVPRQSGKTTLMLALMVHRSLAMGGRQRVGYTAQTGQAARSKFVDDHVPVVVGSMFAKKASIRRANGSEAILWDNGSIWSVLRTTETAGHGAQFDLAVCDEAMALPDDRLEQALKPTMVTRPEPQMWIVSTAGDMSSVWFNGKVDDGRDRVNRGITDGVAFFEWSAPADADPASEDTWRACMPALGHTINIDAIHSDFNSMRLVEFRRAYMNQRQDRSATEPWQVIAEDTWRDLIDLRSRIADEPVLAIDVTPDRSAAAIAAAGLRGDGKLHVEVIEHRTGTNWVVPWFAKRAGRYPHVIVDPSGPAGPLVTQLEAAGQKVRSVKSRWHAHAVSQFYDAVVTGNLAHLGQLELEVALAGAAQRKYGELWLWSRRDLATDVCPLVATSLAVGGVVDPGEEAEVPVRVVSLADLD